MGIGKSMKGMRERKELSQSNIAGDLFVDQTMISKIEKGQRAANKDLVKRSVSIYDDAQYGFEAARETAGGYVTPLATAERAIELHRLALEEVFKTEAMEAIDIFNQVSLVRPPEHACDNEIANITQGIKELLDVQTIMNTFLVSLEQEYGISIKSCMNKRIPHWKSKGWIE